MKAVSESEARGEAGSSRVIIKNLPSYLSEKRLKDHISSIGCNITDVKIVRKKSSNNSGVETSRRFGFVGFYSEEDARRVIEYFNGTFIDTSRISLQFAYPPGSDLLPRPWSKYSVGSSQYNKRNNLGLPNSQSEREAEGPIKEKAEKSNEIKMDNFKKLISQKSSNKSWLDSTDLVDGTDPVKVTSEVVKPTKAGVSNVRKHIQFSESESESESKFETNSETCVIPEDNLSTNVSESELSSELSVQDEQERKEQENEVEKMVTSPTETSRLMVVNLSYSTTEEDLQKFFSKWGEVKTLSIIRSPDSGVSKGYGFVQYEFAEHAVTALSQAHLSLLHGRVLRVFPAFNKPTKPVSDSVNDPTPIIHSSYKLKALNKKKEASLDKRTWNLLYMSGNSAVNAFLEGENVEKHDIVDIEAPDLASRISLVETQVISATKEWLKKEGISVKAFEVEGGDIFSAKLKFEGPECTERSRDTIIIKHLPSDQVSIGDLQKICSPFGQINRLCMSPSRTIAIVQYLEESSANHAFKKIAFKRLKGVPLYVEWAPMTIFSSNSDHFPRSSESQQEALEEIEESSTDRVHVFVKNLSFNTKEESLERLFGKIQGFRKATIAMRSHSDTTGKVTKKSMGYGFLEFKTSEDAKECVKRMQSVALDGHVLELKISKGSKTSQTPVSISTPNNPKTLELGVKSASNKLLIKNLPFQATKSDISSLFSSIGTVTSIRIPKKSDGTNKGYCFVEFLGKLEAIAALEQFQHSHLYGRHLIIEIAEEDQGSSPQKKTKLGE
ncbi:multiple RNA-binding domain-containing protein 1 [Cryptosporidium felis]|nr:multiple RNA-binding domain-containing protein 1 [Cryptosporidium felis]